MAYVYYNSNPFGKIVGDCVIRAISKAEDMPWLKAYTELAMFGMENGDIPSSNNLWGKYLRSIGYKVYPLPNECPDCYTVEQFANEHSKGTYILATGSHVIPLIDGIFYDTWNSGNEPISFYFERVKNDDLQS